MTLLVNAVAAVAAGCAVYGIQWLRDRQRASSGQVPAIANKF
jgi:hypothetical protein